MATRHAGPNTPIVFTFAHALATHRSPRSQVLLEMVDILDKRNMETAVNADSFENSTQVFNDARSRQAELKRIKKDIGKSKPVTAREAKPFEERLLEIAEVTLAGYPDWTRFWDDGKRSRTMPTTYNRIKTQEEGEALLNSVVHYLNRGLSLSRY